MWKNLLCGTAALAVVAVPLAAWAGPCSDDIAALGKQLADKPQLGPPTTGTLTGSSVTPHTQAAPAPSSAGTTASSDARVGGTAGTKELDTASANIATSPQDVRQQQMGKPTGAQMAASGKTETSPGATGQNAAGDDSVSRAKMALQQATDLNAHNDASCHEAVQRARGALGAG